LPKLATVAGVRIVIWPNDHDPPHIHAIFEADCKIAIANGDVLSGSLEPARQIAVLSWLRDNRDAVSLAWNTIRAGEAFKGPIP
jgi:hypothetical protein